MPGSVQGQAGSCFEQPGLVAGVPACGRGVGTRGPLYDDCMYPVHIHYIYSRFLQSIIMYREYIISFLICKKIDVILS